MNEIKFSKVNISDPEKRTTPEGQNELLGTVLYENKNFKTKIPKELQESKGRKLSFFPFKIHEMDFFKDPIGEIDLKTHFNHQRAAELPKVAIQDKFGNIFFRPTIKGLGFLYPEYYESYADDNFGEEEQDISLHETDEYPWGYKVLGLVDERILDSLTDDEKELTKAGLRCESIAGALELKNVIINEEDPEDETKKNSVVMPIEELREYLIEEAENFNLSEDTIEDLENFTPVLLIRLVRDNKRIKDFCKPLTKEEQELAPEEKRNIKIEKRKQALKDVFESLNMENELKKNSKKYSIEDEESIKEYLKDTFEAAGKNLAIIQNKGKMMTFLNSANMTLSLAEIVDVDSMIPLLGRGKIENYSKIHPNICKKYNLPFAPLGYIKDARDELFAAGRMFLKSFKGVASVNENDRLAFCDKFIESYLDTLDEQKLDIILKKNLITSFNDNVFNYELSLNSKRNEELINFLRKNRSKISGIIEYPARLENMENSEEKNKILEIFDALNNSNEVEKVKQIVKDLAERIIVYKENVKSIAKIKKELSNS